MRDGLYRVSAPYLCAGFVVKDGRVSECAPILRKRLSHWKSVAVWLGPDPFKPRSAGATMQLKLGDWLP